MKGLTTLLLLTILVINTSCYSFSNKFDRTKHQSMPNGCFTRGNDKEHFRAHVPVWISADRRRLRRVSVYSKWCPARVSKVFGDKNKRLLLNNIEIDMNKTEQCKTTSKKNYNMKGWRHTCPKTKGYNEEWVCIRNFGNRPCRRQWIGK